MGRASLLGRMAAGSAAVKCKSLMAPISVCDHVRLSTDLGGSPEKVSVNTTLLDGGFGRRGEIDFIVDAVETAKHIDEPSGQCAGPSGWCQGYRMIHSTRLALDRSIDILIYLES
jgi:hypothetical protein